MGEEGSERQCNSRRVCQRCQEKRTGMDILSVYVCIYIFKKQTSKAFEVQRLNRSKAQRETQLDLCNKDRRER